MATLLEEKNEALRASIHELTKAVKLYKHWIEFCADERNQKLRSYKGPPLLNPQNLDWMQKNLVHTEAALEQAKQALAKNDRMAMIELD